MKAHKAQTHKHGIGYDCDICGKYFEYNSSLKRHKLESHATLAKAFACEVCFQTFKSKNFLTGHVRRQHKESYTLDCDSCGKSFKTGDKLNRHVDAVHLQIKIQCDICGGEYKDLGIHKRRMHFVLIGNFPCSLCDKVFSKRYLQKLHMKTTHQNTMKHCDICDKSFLQLKKHMIRQHSGIDQRRTCSICNKTFSENSNLLNHVSRVHSKRLIACEFCDYKGMKSYVQRHARAVHFKSDKYFCNLCGFKSSYKENLKRHIKSTHN